MERAEEPVPDENLILQSQAGDDRALAALFGRYERLLRARARRYLTEAVRAKVSVSDILQEARLAAHLHCKTFVPEGPGSARAWLARIVEREARDVVRRYEGTAKRAVGREVSQGGRSTAGRSLAKGPSPSEAAIAMEAGESARRAMAALPEDYREILRLTRHNGMTLAEAAACMGRSREAVKKLYARALARFTHDLARETGEARG